MDHSMNIKFSWGQGLTLVIFGFIAAMLGMVYITFQQSNEMIEDNYYERELKYQTIIDGKNELSSYASFTFLSLVNNQIVLSLPSELSNQVTRGNILFLKLDNQKFDKKFDIVLGPNSAMYIPKSDLIPGIYRVKIDWGNGDKSYFKEFDFKI
jgi:hypothetical protein